MNLPAVMRVALVLAVSCVGTAAADDWKDESGKGRERAREHSEDWGYPRKDDRGSYFRERGYSRLKIPKGHYPPPGECRIWFPERPPGQQPPPGSCLELRHDVPRGAWLIRHPESDREHVHVIAYDERHPGSILVVGAFEIATGVFVRVVLDR